jgi:hypothetical protein
MKTTLREQDEVMAVATLKGSCFCGAVEFETIGAPLEMGYCHCESCRAYSGGPLNAFALWQTHNVRITRGAEHVGSFNKTGMSDRHFCRQCGGHLITRHPALGLTDVKAGALPDLEFKPVVHLNYAEAAMPVKDGVAKLKDFPTQVGGSGEVIAE